MNLDPIQQAQAAPVRVCDCKGCNNQATHFPVLLLRPKGPICQPAEVVINIRACQACGEKLQRKDLISSDGWKRLLLAFDARGKARPHYRLTEVCIRPVADLPAKFRDGEPGDAA